MIAADDGMVLLETLFTAYDADFVYKAYHLMLNREPDEEGLRVYLAQLRTGVSRFDVLKQLFLSEEAKSQEINPKIKTIIQEKLQEGKKSSKSPLVKREFKVLDKASMHSVQNLIGLEASRIVELLTDLTQNINNIALRIEMLEAGVNAIKTDFVNLSRQHTEIESGLDIQQIGFAEMNTHLSTLSSQDVRVLERIDALHMEFSSTKVEMLEILRQHTDAERSRTGLIEFNHDLASPPSVETPQEEAEVLMDGQPMHVQPPNQNNEVDFIRQSPYFDEKFYLANNVDVRDAGIDPVAHYLHHGYTEQRSPSLQFHADALRLYLLGRTFENPLLHAISHGLNLATSGIHTDLNYRRLQTYPETLLILDRKIERHLNTANRIAIHIHVFYEDVFKAILSNLKPIFPRFADLLLSCSDYDLYLKIKNSFQDHTGVYVELVENKGRDVAPMCVAFGAKILNYDLCLHLHTKKSAHTGTDIGTKWLNSILDALVCRESTMAKIVHLFDSNEQIGVIQSLPFMQIVRHMRWSSNMPYVVDLLKKLDIKLEDIPQFPLYFPAGTMMWFRPKALYQLLNGSLQLDDFPEEPIGTDGTIAHAIERSINYIAAKNGFVTQTVVNNPLNNLPFRLKKIRDACVFCSYSEESYFSYAVLSALRILSNTFEKVFLVTNVRDINNSDMLPTNVEVFFTENKGYDFGMYYRCICHFNITGPVYLLNDSIYIFSDVYKLILEMQDRSLDICGYTVSQEVHLHAQSYFMRLSQAALKEFMLYYQKNGDPTGREEAIHVYELGFSKYIVDNGFSLGGVHLGAGLNPSIFDTVTLIERGYPIIKKKIILNSWADDEIIFLREVDYNFSYDWLALINDLYNVDIRLFASGRVC